MCQDTVTWAAFLHQLSWDSSPILRMSFFISVTNNWYTYIEYLVNVCVPRVSASCLWVMLSLTQKRGWVPPQLIKEPYLDCRKNSNLRLHVFCLHFCFHTWVIKLPKTPPRDKLRGKTVSDLGTNCRIWETCSFTIDLMMQLSNLLLEHELGLSGVS